jgi:Sigma-70, region 4
VVSATSSAGSPDQRQVFRLAFFEEKSQREISALTQTPLGTVKTRIELGIKKLSHALGGLREKVVWLPLLWATLPARGPRHNFISTVLWQLSDDWDQNMLKSLWMPSAPTSQARTMKAQETSVIV